MAESVEPDDFELGEDVDKDIQKSLIRYYFYRGFEYKETFLLLHEITMTFK